MLDIAHKRLYNTECKPVMGYLSQDKLRQKLNLEFNKAKKKVDGSESRRPSSVLREKIKFNGENYEIYKRRTCKALCRT